MSKQKAKKRILRYLVIVETDTDFKEDVLNRFMTSLPLYYKAHFKGKPNSMEVNKLKI